MSKPIARSKPARAATSDAPTTPPAGPESSAFGPRKRSASVSPPDDCMKRSTASGSAARSAAACPRSSGVRYASTTVVSARASSPAAWATSCERRDVLEAELARERRERALHRGIRGGVDQRDRDGAVSGRARPRERTRAPRSRSSGSITRAVGAARARAPRPRRACSGAGFRIVELEELRALLGADREQVREARVRRRAASARRAARAARWSPRSCRARRGSAACALACRDRGSRGSAAPGASSDESTFATCIAPSGAMPMPSVNVPPRSIQNDQPSSRSFSPAQHAARDRAHGAAQSEHRRRAARPRARRARRQRRRTARSISAPTAPGMPSGGTARRGEPRDRRDQRRAHRGAGDCAERRSAVARAQRARASRSRSSPSRSRRRPRARSRRSAGPSPSRARRGRDGDRRAEPHRLPRRRRARRSRAPRSAGAIQAGTANAKICSSPATRSRVLGVETPALVEQPHDRLGEHERRRPRTRTRARDPRAARRAACRSSSVSRPSEERRASVGSAAVAIACPTTATGSSISCRA